MTDDRREALAFSGLVFGLTSSLAYLLERLYERLRAGRGAPQLVISEVHATFYWRATLAAWLGLVVALLVYRSLRQVTPGATRWMMVLLLILTPVATWWAVQRP